MVDRIVLLRILLELMPERLLPDVGRVADHHIKPTALQDPGKLPLPVKRIDPFALLDPGQDRKTVVDIRSDKRVPALDVIMQARERTLRKQGQLLRYRLLALILKDLQEEGEFRHLDRLLVNIHTIDVVREDPFPLSRGQSPVAPHPRVSAVRRLVDRDLFGCVPAPSSPMPLRPLPCRRKKRPDLGRGRPLLLQHRDQMLDIPVPVPVQQELVGPKQERTRTAGRIQYRDS